MKRFKVGDKVKFTNMQYNNIRNKFYCEPDGIPNVLIKHGYTTLDKEHYLKNFAEVVELYDKYIIVEHKDGEGGFTQLGYLPDSLELATINWKERLSRI